MKKCKCSDDLLQDSVVKCPKCESEDLEIDLDNSGVPLKNREAEIARKRKEIESEKERIKQENERLRIERERFEAIKNNPDTVKEHYQKEEERTGVEARTLEEVDRRVNERAKQIVEQANREKEQADFAVNSILNELQDGDYPAIAKYRDEIIAEIRVYSVTAQKNPELIKKLAFGVLGKNEGIKKETKKEAKVVVNPTITGGGSGSGTQKTVQLSDEEVEFSNNYGFKNRDDKEIRSLYNEYLKTHPKK